MKYLHTTALPTLLACVLLAPGLPALAQQAVGNDACPALLQHSFLRLQDEKPQSLCQYRGKVPSGSCMVNEPCCRRCSSCSTVRAAAGMPVGRARRSAVVLFMAGPR